MSSSRKPGSLIPPMGICQIPSRTPGPFGINDQGDPDVTTLLGDTPGPLGINDWAMPDLPANHPGAIGLAADGTLLSKGADGGGTVSADRRSASSFSLGSEARKLLQQVEALHLKPYDDQTGKDISAWVEGATIGYGHLVAKGDWDTYKNGISESDANTLFDQDLAPFVTAVQTQITASITQCEFDALVILAFNIGAPSFGTSAVVTLINDPKAATNYSNVESAWKAWNKSQGKVMSGLANRRQCEWDIYAHGIYKSW